MGFYSKKTIRLYSGIVKASVKYINKVEKYINEVEELEKLWDISRLRLDKASSGNIRVKNFLKNETIKHMSNEYKARLDGATYNRKKLSDFIDNFKLISVVGGEDTIHIKARYARLLGLKQNNNLEIDYIIKEYKAMNDYFITCNDFISTFKVHDNLEFNIEEQKDALMRINDILSKLLNGSEILYQLTYGSGICIEDLYISELERGVKLANERED